MLPSSDNSTISDALTGLFRTAEADTLTRIDLPANGLDCDVVVVWANHQLKALVNASTLSANLLVVLERPEPDGDRADVYAATRAVGAIGYVIADYGAKELSLFTKLLSQGLRIDQSLEECGPHLLVADDDALAISPLEAFRRAVAAVEREPPVPPLPGVPSAPQSLAPGYEELILMSEREGCEEDEEQHRGNDGAGAEHDAHDVGEALDRRRAGPTGVARFLQAELRRRNADDGTLAESGESVFIRNQPMAVLVGIGPLGPARLVANVKLNEALLGQPGPQGWDLDITLKPANGDIQRQSLQLPATGSSTDVRFDIHTDTAEDVWAGRLTVWHRRRAIQSAILSGPVVDTETDAFPGEHASLVVDGEFHPMTELDNHSAGGATIEEDGHPALYTSDGDFLIEPRADELKTARGRIAEKLGEMAAILDKTSAPKPENTRALLEYLAVQGRLLFEALFPSPEQREAVKKERFLQALRLRANSDEMPYEFIYDRDSPAPNAALCTSWTAGISDGICPGCHTPAAATGEPAASGNGGIPTDRRAIICPLGFWGLSKVIERHNGVEADETRGQARLRRCAVPGGKGGVVQIRRAAIALSRIADNKPRGARADEVLPSARIVNALTEAGIEFDGPIDDWNQWDQVISKNQPDLLIVLGHADIDPKRDEWYMQIGAERTGSRLYLSLVRPEDVDVPRTNPGPVVFLFGCLTAQSGSGQAPFASKFQENNAAIVAGTTSTVLGRQAGPVTADLIAAIKAGAGTVSLGELLRRARANGLASGSLMAMTITAYGDADYRISM